jgi:hypothetical protein
LRLGYGRFQRIFVADPVQAAPRFNLVLVNRVDLFAGQKERYLFQGSSLREDRLFRESAKQAGVQYGRLSMGFSEPFVGGVSYPGRFLVLGPFSVLRLN